MHPLTFTLSRLTAGMFQPILAHVGVAFPSGRLQNRFEKIVVASAYVLWMALTLSVLMLWYPPDDGCAPPLCSTNLLLVTNNRALHGTAEQISIFVSIAVTLVVVALVLYHWWTASPAGRRGLSPVLWSALPIGGVTIAVSLLGVSFTPPLATLAFTALPVGFLIGLLRLHLHRAAVGELVIELDHVHDPSGLRDALARTLDDPGLEVAYWIEERNAFVDLDGNAMALPGPGSGRAATLLHRDGLVSAALVHDAALEDPQLIQAAGSAARLAIENAQLQAEIRAQLQEVRASRARIVEATDAERRRLERDLHDGAQQRLVTLSLSLTLARTRLAADQHASELIATLSSALDELKLALAELRELARGIHPAILTQAGLGAAIASLAERCPLPVTLAAVPDARFPPPVEAVAYFLVAEALTNAAKHAGNCSIIVRITFEADQLQVEVQDNGNGGADARHGTGLQGLADRVGAHSGRFCVDSPPGGGTRIRADIPCVAAADEVSNVL